MGESLNEAFTDGEDTRYFRKQTALAWVGGKRFPAIAVWGNGRGSAKSVLTDSSQSVHTVRDYMGPGDAVSQVAAVVDA